MSYTELYCHFVWATKGRMPLLVGARAGMAEAAIRTAAREQRAVVHAIGSMPDHVHVAASFPATVTIAALVKAIKGSSSHLLNRATGDGEPPFAWQAEYGALTFGKRSLASVVAYVCNQAEHHAGNNLWATFELTERPYRPGADDER